MSPPILERSLTTGSFETPRPIPQTAHSYVRDMPTPDHLWTSTISADMAALQHRPSVATSSVAGDLNESSVLLGLSVPTHAEEGSMESIHYIEGDSPQVELGSPRTPSPPVDSPDASATPSISSLYDFISRTSRGGNTLQPTGSVEPSFSSLTDIPQIPECLPSTGLETSEKPELIAAKEEEIRLLVWCILISRDYLPHLTCDFFQMELEKLESRKRQLRKERKAWAAANRRVLNNAGAGSPEMIDLTVD